MKNKVLQNPDFADRIARQAREDVLNYAWKKRAERIIEFIRVKVESL